MASEEISNTKTKYNFTINWNKLNYVVEKRSVFNKVTFSKLIFSDLSGSIRSGELTGIMGPSGAGKSTLLECLFDIRKRGRTGNIMFTGSNKIKIKYIPQFDHLPLFLTVKEALVLSCKFQYHSYKNSNQENDDSDDLDNVEESVNRTLSQLGLENCSNVKISSCSGGQKRRISVAQELVSKPNILILDEPTTGLDSSSCFQTIEVLMNLTQNVDQMAIILTIHQPSARVFSMFHKIYCVARGGHCIYDGNPKDLIDDFKAFDINCPAFTNPADFMIDVAVGDHGDNAILKLSSAHSSKQSLQQTFPGTIQNCNLDEAKKSFQNLWWKDFWNIFIRASVRINRDPFLGIFRIASNVIMALFYGVVYGSKVGQASGCPPDIFRNPNPAEFEGLGERMESDLKLVRNNFGLLFLSLFGVMFSTLMPIIVSFPSEMSTLVKETYNGWYGLNVYFLARTFADLPIQVLCALCHNSILYWITNQPYVLWRFGYHNLNILIASLIAQSQGIIVGTIFNDDVTTAVFVGALFTCVLVMFCGFLIDIDAIPWIFMPFVDLNSMKYSLQALMVTIYGFGRCGNFTYDLIENAQRGFSLYIGGAFKKALADEDYDFDEEPDTSWKNYSKGFTDLIFKPLEDFQDPNNQGSVRSFVLANFKLSEDMLSSSLIYMAIALIVSRFIAYFVLVRKVRSLLSK